MPELWFFMTGPKESKSFTVYGLFLNSTGSGQLVGTAPRSSFYLN